MKGLPERKLITGGLVLTLLLIGILRINSYQNAIALIESGHQAEQLEDRLNHLLEISAALADAEAGRATYLLTGSEFERQRHAQAVQRLEQQLQQLNPSLSGEAQSQSDLARLRSLLAQRRTLTHQSLSLVQATDLAASETPAQSLSAHATQTRLNEQLNQNRLAIQQILDRIRVQKAVSLDNWDVEFLRHTRYHLSIELLGTALSLALVLGLYALLYRQLDRRRRAEAAQQELAQAKAMGDLKLRFFSMVSHEFRTPLSIILGSAQLLAEADSPNDSAWRHKTLERIQACARSLNQRLTDILTLTRAEAGKLECHPTLIDLESFCLNLVEDLQLGSGTPQRIQFISEGYCPKAELDENLLQTILSNLLSNALKYSPADSPVALSLQCEAGTVKFQVQDHGDGIPPADQANLYKPFYRGQNVGKTPGSGLGLAVVKKCLDLQQGEIFVDSTVGVGTTITVKIPIPQTAQQHSLLQGRQQPGGTNRQPEPERPSGIGGQVNWI